MFEQHDNPSPVGHAQQIDGQASAGVAVAGDVTGNVQHQEQSGGVNLGQGNRVESIGTIAAQLIERYINMGGLSPSQAAWLLKSPKEQSQRWQQLVDEILKIELVVHENLLISLATAVWRRDRPIDDYQDSRGLFRKLISVHHSEQPSNPDQLLIFIYLLADQLPPADGNTLRSWLQRAADTWLIDLQTVAAWGEPVLHVYRELLRMRSSLLIAIKPRAGHADYHLWIGIDRPRIGQRVLLAEDDKGYTLAEIQQQLTELRQRHRLPRWAEGRITVEFLLPFDLLRQLCGAWKFDTWPCAEFEPARGQLVPRDLGRLHPIVVRSSDRPTLNYWLDAKNLWEKKWSFLSRWMAGGAGGAPGAAPRSVTSHTGHAHYTDPERWGEDDTIVAMVLTDAVDSVDSSDYEEGLIAMLQSGLPVGIWLTPGASVETCSQYMEAFFSAEMLRDLPLKLWEQRRAVKTSTSPAANVVLFWDDCERTPRDNTLWSPDEET